MKMNDENNNNSNTDSTVCNQYLNSDPYFSYFNMAPLAIWVEDLSIAKAYLEKKVLEHTTNVETYLLENPEIVDELAEMVVIKDVNQTAVDLYKAKSKEELFQNLDKIFTKKSYVGFAKLLTEIFLGNKDAQIETENKTLEGVAFDISLKYTFTDPSKQHVIIVIEDITERVKIREQLANSELRYKEAQAISKLGSWSYDFNLNEIFWSDELYKIIGIEPQKIVPDLNFYSSLILEEDKEKATNFSIEFLLKNRKQQITYRIITPGNKLKYINEYRNVLVENDRIVKLAGTSQDITKSVLNEQKIKSY